jgi:hypothetical protein
MALQVQDIALQVQERLLQHLSSEQLRDAAPGTKVAVPVTLLYYFSNIDLNGPMSKP